MSGRQAPGERSRTRKAVIAAALPLGLLAALIVQLTVVNRLPLPGGDAPDLVLLLVVAVAVRATPLTGALAGFAGGLALDVAPPQAHDAGEYALVFCLAGYGAARVAVLADDGGGDQPVLVPLAIAAAAAAAGEAGKAALGLLLSDPNVTGPAIRHVLPGSALDDLLLSPVALWLVTSVAGRPAAASVPRPERAAARLAAVFGLASAGTAPAPSPRKGLAGSGPAHRRPSWAGHEPKLRRSGVRARSFARTNGAGSSTALPLLAGRRATKLGFSSRASRASRPRASRPRVSHPRVSHPRVSHARPSRVSRPRVSHPRPSRVSRPRVSHPRTSRPSRLSRLSRPSRRWSRAFSGEMAPRATSAGRSRTRSPSRGWLRAWDFPFRGAVPYVSRPYPTRRRSYRRRLLAIVGVRR